MDVIKKCPECGKVWCVDCGGGPNTPDCPKCHPKKSKDEIIAEQQREIYALKRWIVELERREASALRRRVAERKRSEGL